MRNVGWNSQRNNISFNGSFRGVQQCFSTSAWMLLSWFAPEAYRADDDEGLARYVADVCNVVNQSGIGEQVAEQEHLSGNSAYYWDVHVKAIEKWLKNAGKIPVVWYKDGNGTRQQLLEALQNSPVIIGTQKLGGLPGGHIILLADWQKGFFSVRDPYGNATTGYRDINGEAFYSEDFLLPSATLPSGSMRFLWVTLS